jgi:hypothetical protein
MFQITDDARELIKSGLQQAGKLGDGCYRLVATPQGAKLGLDVEKPEDIRVEHEGQLVLVMDRDTADLFDDRTLGRDPAGRLTFS